MTREEATSLIRRLYDKVFNGHDPSLLDEFFTDDFISYSAGYDGPLDRDGAKWAVADYIRAFPDAQWEIESLIVDGDNVAWRDSFAGTHERDLHGFPPTGRRVQAEGMSMAELRDGKVWRHWSIFDNLSILLQVDIVQMKEPPASAEPGSEEDS
jgi:predicted ester cyclase